MTRALLSLLFLAALFAPLSSVEAQFWSGDDSEDAAGPNVNQEDPAGPNTGGSVLTNPLQGVETLDQLLGKVLDALIAIGTVVVTIMIVYTGFLFVMAQGNPEGLTKAKSVLLWTIIGGFLVLGARVIQEIISSTVTGLGGS